MSVLSEFSILHRRNLSKGEAFNYGPHDEELLATRQAINTSTEPHI